jgi:hypothetical protein
MLDYKIELSDDEYGGYNDGASSHEGSNDMIQHSDVAGSFPDTYVAPPAVSYRSSSLGSASSAYAGARNQTAAVAVSSEPIATMRSGDIAAASSFLSQQADSARGLPEPPGGRSGEPVSMVYRSVSTQEGENALVALNEGTGNSTLSHKEGDAASSAGPSAQISLSNEAGSRTFSADSNAAVSVPDDSTSAVPALASATQGVLSASAQQAHAIHYVTKIRSRFHSEPETYK